MKSIAALFSSVLSLIPGLPPIAVSVLIVPLGTGCCPADGGAGATENGDTRQVERLPAPQESGHSIKIADEFAIANAASRHIAKWTIQHRWGYRWDEQERVLLLDSPTPPQLSSAGGPGAVPPKGGLTCRTEGDMALLWKNIYDQNRKTKDGLPVECAQYRGTMSLSNGRASGYINVYLLVGADGYAVYSHDPVMWSDDDWKTESPQHTSDHMRGPVTKCPPRPKPDHPPQEAPRRSQSR